MKPYFYLLALLFLWSAPVKAQIPDYFGNNPAWVAGFYDSGWPDSDVAYSDEIRVRVNGEQFIGGHLYHVLERRLERTYDFDMGVPSLITTTTVMNVRQEGRSIYFYEPVSGQDSLFIDYNLEVGDSFTGHFGVHVGGDVMVTGIDSVLVGDNYRRMLYTGEGGINHFVVEGIATISDGGTCGFYFAGLFIGYCGIGFDYSFSCYGENNVSLFGLTDCALTLDIEESESSVDTKVYPNPAYDLFRISANIAIDNVCIYTPDGKKLVSKAVNATEAVIDISGIAKGYYFVRINYVNGGGEETVLLKE